MRFDGLESEDLPLFKHQNSTEDRGDENKNIELCKYAFMQSFINYDCILFLMSS